MLLDKNGCVGLLFCQGGSFHGKDCELGIHPQNSQADISLILKSRQFFKTTKEYILNYVENL